MNVNLAPVLDVYYKPGNFIDQYQRSYSNNPAVASGCGQAFITAQQQTGVAATAKHFPGLGSATKNQNTDNGPVTLTVSLTKLHTVDEVPYPAAVSAGVKLVMVSWAIYPALDARLPAGLSPAVIGQELRGRNAFTGVTITDALEAGALSAFGTTSQRAVTAAGAGMDLILCSARDVSQGGAATAALASALASGQLDPTAFNAAVNRVTALRTSLP
jgi:beta-N-acetylhexosaminidase